MNIWSCCCLSACFIGFTSQLTEAGKRWKLAEVRLLGWRRWHGIGSWGLVLKRLVPVLQGLVLVLFLATCSLLRGVKSALLLAVGSVFGGSGAACVSYSCYVGLSGCGFSSCPWKWHTPLVRKANQPHSSLRCSQHRGLYLQWWPGRVYFPSRAFCSCPVPQQRLNSSVTTTVSTTHSSSSIFYFLLAPYLSLCFGSDISSRCAHSSESWNPFWRGGRAFELLLQRVCARIMEMGIW